MKVNTLLKGETNQLFSNIKKKIKHPRNWKCFIREIGDIKMGE